MGADSKIEWTTHTFNPWIGCQKVSPGCDHCYAEAMMDHRYGKVKWGPHGERKRTSEASWRKPLAWAKAARRTGERPRVFCASLADWLDNKVSDDWRSDLYDLIRETPELDWLMLTKRPENFGRLFPNWQKHGCPPHVWIGTTAEDQEHLDRCVPHLLKIPARVRFLSCEPLIGPISFRWAKWDNWCNPDDSGRATINHLDGLRMLNWIIVGGESGHGARPMNPQWARDIRDECAEAGVPFLFKQWGEFASVSEVEGPGAHFHFPDGHTVRRVGKHRAGRTLDHVEHNGFPVQR